MDRPYTILSCAMSVDGRIDDTGPERLRLSNEADFAEVDALRAECDAILVGAGTLRTDNPRLLVRSPALRERRRERGSTENLLKALVTHSGRFDPGARFFSTGDAGAVVYTGGGGVDTARRALAKRPATDPPAEVVDAGDPPTAKAVLADLAERGVGRLLVEGGGHIHTLFLTSGLVDELRLAIAPFFVGEEDAPSFTLPGTFTHTPNTPMRLVETRALGDVAVLRYLLGPERVSTGPPPAEGRADEYWLRRTVELSRSCPPSDTAFSVGCAVVAADGTVLGEGHSRRDDPHDHAEEVALREVEVDDPRLADATLYSSLEPCTSRSSRARSCTELVLATPVPRVVFAWREPTMFVDCDGAERLRAAGRSVVERPDLATGVCEVNSHLLG